MLYRISIASALSLSLVGVAGATSLVDFDDLPLAPNSHYNGADLAGGFVSGNTFFKNDYSIAWSSWRGFAYSNKTDTVTPGYGNEFSSYAGGGSATDGSAVPGNHFAIAFGFGPTDAYFNIPHWAHVNSIRVTNTTLTALDMRDGSPFGFSKKFGGVSGNDPDWFKVIFTGYDQPNAQGNATGVAQHYLADFRFADNALDYILNTWDLVDLTPLGNARSVTVTFDSSDIGPWGINTPTYAALDNLTLAPEPSAGIGLVLALTAFVRRRNHG